MSGHKARIVIGRTVIVERQDSDSSIPVENPAIITRHHGAGVINCRVFEDGHHIPWLTSIPKKHKLGPHAVQPLNWWFWPPRSPSARAEGEAERRDAEQAKGDQPERVIPHQGIGTGQHPPPGQQGIGGGQGLVPERVPGPEPQQSQPGTPESEADPRNPHQPALTLGPNPDWHDPPKEETKPAPGANPDQPTPKPTNPTAPPVEEKTGDHSDKPGIGLPPPGYRP